jgi:hypothetical protein
MDNLFDHPGFKLIFIDDNGNMSLIIPLEHKEDILEKGYRCISHVWMTGTQKEHVWKDHPIKNVLWEVEVRKEKHERLLQVFHHHKGYFWMDVFCTNQEDINKPLDVMGNIYRYCKECVCLLDYICDIPGFTSEKAVLEDMAKDIKEAIETNKSFTDKYGYMYDNDIPVLSLQYRYNLYLNGITFGKWNQRVWTWQEAVLPPKLIFCSEQTKGYRYDPYGPKFLKEIFPYKLMEFATTEAVDKEIEREFNRFENNKTCSMLLYIQPLSCLGRRDHSLWDNVKIAAESGRQCTNREDYIYGIMGILDLDIPKGLRLDDAMVELEKELQKKGIFIGGNRDISYVDQLGNLYCERYVMDGIAILNRVDNISSLGTFDPDVGVISHENHGKILFKSKYDSDYKGHKHIGYEYVTETIKICLESDKYNVGDIIQTTKIGRKGCTFRSQDNVLRNDIFEIIGNGIRIIGFIGDEVGPNSNDSGNKNTDDSEGYEE